MDFKKKYLKAKKDKKRLFKLLDEFQDTDKDNDRLRNEKVKLSILNEKYYKKYGTLSPTPEPKHCFSEPRPYRNVIRETEEILNREWVFNNERRMKRKISRQVLTPTKIQILSPIRRVGRPKKSILIKPRTELSTSKNKFSTSFADEVIKKHSRITKTGTKIFDVYLISMKEKEQLGYGNKFENAEYKLLNRALWTGYILKVGGGRASQDTCMVSNCENIRNKIIGSPRINKHKLRKTFCRDCLGMILKYDNIN